MGRPRKSDEQKRLSGTLQPCRASGTINGLDTLSDVKPPSWLTKQAKVVFRQKATQLMSIKVLTQLDVDALVLYAAAYAEVVAALEALDVEGRVCRKIDKEGNEVLSVSPWVKIYTENIKVVNQIGGQFGFTPSSRASITAMANGGKVVKDEFDEFE